MESASGRGNVVVAFAMSWSMFMIAAVNIEQYVADRKPVIDFDVRKTQLYLAYDDDRLNKVDTLAITFDLDVDMTNVFDWNTWTVFMYLVAEYETPDRPLNQVMVWDHIMTSDTPDPTLQLRKKRWKYPVTDMGNALLGNENVTMQFHFVRIPFSGRISDTVAGPTRQIAVPASYKK